MHMEGGGEGGGKILKWTLEEKKWSFHISRKIVLSAYNDVMLLLFAQIDTECSAHNIMLKYAHNFMSNI